MRPSYLNSVKILEMVKRMNLIAQTNDQLNAFELKFLREPLPRLDAKEEESVEIAGAAVTQINPKNATMGTLGQMKVGLGGKGKNTSFVPPVLMEGGEEHLNATGKKVPGLNKRTQPKRKIIRDDLSRASASSVSEHNSSNVSFQIPLPPEAKNNQEIAEAPPKQAINSDGV